MRWLAVLACAAASGAAVPQFTEKEIALGRQMGRELEREHRLSRDAAARAYVARVGGRLAAAAGSSGPWAFAVLEGAEPAVAALPGGRVYVGEGVLTRAKTEAELAGVLAHLMAHVAERHGTREKDDQGVSHANTPLVFVGGWAGVCAVGSPELPLPVALREKLPVWEKEADETGRGYLRRAGYDPEALEAILARLRR